MQNQPRFVLKNSYITYIASLFSSIILLIVLHGYIDNFILYGWFTLNLLIIAVRIGLSKIHLFPNDDLKNRKYRKIPLYIGITASGLVWASTAWLLFPQDDLVRQLFLVFVLMGMTAGSPAASASSIVAFLCFSQPILLALSLRFLYEGEKVFYIMAVLTQIHNVSMIITSINFTKIHKRFRIAKDTAETASLTKSEFLANISHEVRTPINAIVGINYLLKQTTLTRQQLDFVDKSLIASNSLLGSIDNILGYSKIEQKKFDLEISSFHLDDILNTVTTLVEFDAKKKALIFTGHIEKNTTTYLRGDSVKLVQILKNLSENAVKFTDKGEVELTIKQIEQTDSKVLTHFSIRDTGIGIHFKDHNKLFKSFSQVNTTYSRQYGGTGLGLSISQQLANFMGSEIEFESEPNLGSTFYFSIWFETCLDSLDNIDTNHTELTDSSSINLDPQILPALTGYTILLIEDDELNQLVARELLILLGAKVEIASTAQQAFDSLETHLPDLILLDIQMPHIDGYGTIAVIRSTSEWKDLPVICLTAHAGAIEKEKSLAAGMDDFLTKPINPSELHNVLVKWLPPEPAKHFNDELKRSSNHSQREITQNLINVMDMLENKETRMTFLKNVTSSLTKSVDELQQYLTKRDWKQASICAHRLRGTANLYASSTLQQCLQDIDDFHINKQNVNKTQELLNIEFALVAELMTNMMID
ncbi:MAG: response regulator [Thiotrichaceae bacterium]